MATATQRAIASSADGLSHGDRVELNVDSGNLLAEPEEIFGSWQRSLVDYHVDARDLSAPHVVTQNELNVFREPVETLLAQAQEEIDRLYAVVRQHAYVVLLCNRDGVAIHHRGDDSHAAEFKQWGIWVGGVWSEQTEGTNGIGTCIASERPVLVHGDQHFRSRHTQLSCAGAPIFDPHGELVAVLDVSRVEGQEDKGPLPLVLDTVVFAARAIEERLFREHFRHAWIAAALPPGHESALLLALDENQWMVGADRVARDAVGLSDQSMADGRHLSTVFEHDSAIFRQTGDRDIPARFARAGGGAWWSILLTPPLSKSRAARSWAEAFVHSRPRISTLDHLPVAEPPARNRGGLPPVVTQRICEYMESHLDQKVALDALASMAGLSTHHFARAFHQSVGVPPHSYLLSRRLERGIVRVRWRYHGQPHSYLLSRRLERAERMLRETSLTLAEIALATGFADQSHLARHFRRRTGMPPSLARWRER